MTDDNTWNQLSPTEQNAVLAGLRKIQNHSGVDLTDGDLTISGEGEELVVPEEAMP